MSNKSIAITSVRISLVITTAVSLSVPIGVSARSGSEGTKLELEISSAADVATIIIDDLDEGFIRHGTPQYWWDASIGYRKHMFWTYVNGDTVDDWAEWRPDLPQCGSYQVSVFIPSQYATTQSAKYEVYHRDGDQVVVISQIDYSDEWVNLGTYNFDAGTKGYVRLTDATGEAFSTRRQVGFDAVRWELKAPCLVKIYLPLVMRNYSLR